METIKTSCNGDVISINIIRSKRRSFSLEVNSAGINMRIPEKAGDKAIDDFLKKSKPWLCKKLALYQDMNTGINSSPEYNIPSPENLTKDETQKICDCFAYRVQYYAQIMGVTYNRISIKNQKTIWGSCSSKGNLNFNYKLYYLDRHLLDYVVIHELAHRRYMNHSKLFWNEVAIYCSDYKECEKTLKAIAISLSFQK